MGRTLVERHRPDKRHASSGLDPSRAAAHAPTMLQCHFCGAAMTLGEPIGREATCDSCARDLKCCLQCRHHDPNYNNECTETMADPVVEKDRRNFCEYFYFSRTPFAAGAPQRDRKAEARSKLDALFRKKPKDE